jgi:hypothetical protein
MLAFHMPMKQVTHHAGVKFVYEVCAKATYSLNNSTVKIYISTADDISKKWGFVFETQICH